MLRHYHLVGSSPWGKFTKRFRKILYLTVIWKVLVMGFTFTITKIMWAWWSYDEDGEVRPKLNRWRLVAWDSITLRTNEVRCTWKADTCNSHNRFQGRGDLSTRFRHPMWQWKPSLTLRLSVATFKLTHRNGWPPGFFTETMLQSDLPITELTVTVYLTSWLSTWSKASSKMHLRGKIWSPPSD